MTRASAKIIDLGSPPSSGANEEIDLSQPYRVQVTIHGIADFLYHRWNVEAVAEKAAAAKGSKAKKSDNIASYVYRMDDDDPTSNLAIPGEYLRGSITNAAKFFQDPRSPRKSAMDLFKAGVVTLTPMADVGRQIWDYEDKRRVQVQRAGITRTRPALKAGWKATFILLVTVPEYISQDLLRQVLIRAGQLVGLGDYRPTYGRYTIDSFEVLHDDDPE